MLFNDALEPRHVAGLYSAYRGANQTNGEHAEGWMRRAARKRQLWCRLQPSQADPPGSSSCCSAVERVETAGGPADALGASPSDPSAAAAGSSGGGGGLSGGEIAAIVVVSVGAAMCLVSMAALFVAHRRRTAQGCAALHGQEGQRWLVGQHTGAAC